VRKKGSLQRRLPQKPRTIPASAHSIALRVLCADCLELLLTDPEAFWRPLRERRGGGG
jgi:hypothetical protein